MSKPVIHKTIDAYILANPEHLVEVSMNVQHSETDKRLRVNIMHRRGPYRPVNLGLYVVDTVEEGLVNVQTRTWSGKVEDNREPKGEEQANG